MEIFVGLFICYDNMQNGAKNWWTGEKHWSKIWSKWSMLMLMPMLIQTKWWVQIGSIAKNGVLPVATSFSKNLVSV